MFNYYSSLLGAAGTLPAWISTSFPIIKYVLLAFMGLAAIAIIILVLSQQSNSNNNVAAITGGQDTYYAHNKGQSIQGRLKKATTVLAICMGVATIIYFILSKVVA